MPDTPQNDHDALILLKARVGTLEGQITSLCTKIDIIGRHQTDNHREILKRLDEKFDAYAHDCSACKTDINDDIVSVRENRVPWSSFKWIFGGTMSVVIAFLMVVGALSWDTRNYVERHIIFSEMVYYQITGQRWDKAARESLLKARDQWELYKNGDAGMHALPTAPDDGTGHPE